MLSLCTGIFPPTSQLEIAVNTAHKSIIGIEFVLPFEQWRTKPEGTRVFADLLHELSPYRSKSIRTRALRRLAERSTCLLAATDLDAKHHGHTIGVARFVVRHADTARFGEIHDVVVARTHRQQGVGTALVKKALSVATDLKLPFVDVAIKPARVRAKKMFRKLGFQLVAAADPAVIDSEDRYRFEFPKPEEKKPQTTSQVAQ